MPSAKTLFWNKEKRTVSHQQNMLSGIKGVLVFTILLFLVFYFTGIKPLSRCDNEKGFLSETRSIKTESLNQRNMLSMQKFNCTECPQAAPVVANKVEGVHFPFFISIADLGSPEKPNRNFLRMLKGKAFRKPDISETIQDVLQKLESDGRATKHETVIDVGANVGMAAFAASAMGYKVLAFEAVFENLQRLCDGLYLNRATDKISLYHAAVSDVPGNLTMHKVIGRLDNSAVSATGAKLAFKSSEVVSVTVKSIMLDTVISQSEPVILLKIDVQGWEYHVLKGASHLLSREQGHAPYIIYEDDEKLLKESNSTSKDIKDFLESVGYHSCTRHGTDTHCRKE